MTNITTSETNVNLSDVFAPPTAPTKPSCNTRKSTHRLGVASFVIGLLGSAYWTYKLGSVALFGALLSAKEQVFAGSQYQSFYQKMLSFVHLETLRIVPLVVLSALLVRSGLKLVRKQPEAIRSARRWSFWALGATVVSAGIIMFGELPLLYAWFPGATSTDSGAALYAYGWVAVSTLLLAVWPTITARWAGRLMKHRKPAAQPCVA